MRIPGSIRVSLVLVVVLACWTIDVVAQDDPTFCLAYHERSYDCNCHTCNCEQCHTCACETKTLFWESCSWDSCGDQGCWCSPTCRCCYKSNCRSECNCETCCDTCVETQCESSISYSVHSISPSIVPAHNPPPVIVSGGYFVATQGLRCRFGTVITSAELVSNNALRCQPPNVTVTPGVPESLKVSVTLDDGEHWTINNITLHYEACLNGCSGHGTCGEDSMCNCEQGYTGEDCSIACPTNAGVVCSGKGSCTEAGACLCDSGFWGVNCNGTCATGLGNKVCSGSDHGACSPTSGVCECEPGFTGDSCQHAGTCNDQGTACSCQETGYWGAGCSQVCPGSTGCNPGVGCTLTCSGHGLCTREGTCICEAGYFGASCGSACPSANGEPCAGHAPTGTCDTTGKCICSPGWSGLDCATECPGGSATPCSNHGECTAANLCECEEGYTGAACSNVCPTSNGKVCNDHGTCTSQGTCECNRGYRGTSCQLECPGGAASPCSGHGSCSTAGGTCVCDFGYYGTDCSDACPGPVDHPCNDHGHCGTSGLCACDIGYFGNACANSCPMHDGKPCGGGTRGSCGANGECTCNNPYSGTACQTVICPFNCYGHGTCDALGVCHCSAGWDGIYCSTQTTPQFGSATFQFQPTRYHAVEDIGTMTLNVSRGGSTLGDVYVWYTTADGSAKADLDYVPVGGKLVWASGDKSLRQVQVTILGDNDPEGTELFVVNLYGASPGSSVAANATITISGNDNTGFDETATITVGISLPAGDLALDTVQGAMFATNFQDDLANVAVLNIAASRIEVRSVESNTVSSSLYTFLLLGTPGSSVADLTVRLLDQISDPTSAIWHGVATRYLDISFQPQVEFDLQPEPEPAATYWWVLGIFIPLTVIATCLGCAYKKRHQLTEWLLWRLGNFRFSSLMKNRQLNLDDDDDDDNSVDDNRALNPVSL